MNNEQVDISLSGVFGTSFAITGTAEAQAAGLHIDYRITPKEIPLVRRGLKDTTVPWSDIIELNVEKRMIHYRLHIRTRTIDPLTGHTMPHENQLWFFVGKENWEQAEKVCIGLQEFRLKKETPELDAAIDEVWDFIHDL